MMRPAAALFLIALPLVACGQPAPLQPAGDSALPPAPYGREDQPTSEELLEPDVLAAPVRDNELRTRSEEREDDPFDLPPQ